VVRVLQYEGLLDIFFLRIIVFLLAPGLVLSLVEFGLTVTNKYYLEHENLVLGGLILVSQPLVLGFDILNL